MQLLYPIKYIYVIFLTAMSDNTENTTADIIIIVATSIGSIIAFLYTIRKLKIGQCCTMERSNDVENPNSMGIQLERTDSTHNNNANNITINTNSLSPDQLHELSEQIKLLANESSRGQREDKKINPRINELLVELNELTPKSKETLMTSLS